MEISPNTFSAQQDIEQLTVLSYGYFWGQKGSKWIEQYLHQNVNLFETA